MAIDKVTAEKEEETNEVGEEISELRRRRAVLECKLTRLHRLETWRQQAVRQAAAGGPRGVEIEVRPIYILPDTNCYIDWLEGVARLTQPSSNYTVLVPIVGWCLLLDCYIILQHCLIFYFERLFVKIIFLSIAVFNELDYLASQDRTPSLNFIDNTFAQYLVNPNSTNVDGSGGGNCRANLIQERAKAAIAFLEGEFDRRNPRLRALTAKGNMLETIAYRNEVNGGKQPGQINDDVILTCCRRFCKEALAQMSAEGKFVPTAESKSMSLFLTTNDPNLILCQSIYILTIHIWS